MADVNIFNVGGMLRKIDAMTTQAGAPYASLRVAVDCRSKEGGHASMEIPFSLFGSWGETALQALGAGDEIMVTGRLRVNQRGYPETQATGFALVRKAVNVPPLQAGLQQAPRPAPAPVYGRQPQQQVTDEDLPF